VKKQIMSPQTGVFLPRRAECGVSWAGVPRRVFSGIPAEDPAVSEVLMAEPPPRTRLLFPMNIFASSLLLFFLCSEKFAALYRDRLLYFFLIKELSPC
jgi:hypothetical protein